MTTRILDLTGIHNFRDYGGYRTSDGGQVKTGILFRSGQHRDATPEDLQTVSRLALATIVDLRSDSERELHPCRRADDHAADVVFAPGNTLGAGSHLDAGNGVRTAAEAHDAMVDLYRQMPFRQTLTQTYRMMFDRLIDGHGPSLVHCLAGKDRTGLAVALVQHQLGVHHDDIVEDYLLTNVAGDMDRRIAAGADAVRANFGPDMENDAVRTLMSVHPAYLDAALEEIGDVDRNCEEVLGLSPARRDTLRRELVA
jgi:protein tyrosine/serine phosphatase